MSEISTSHSASGSSSSASASVVAEKTVWPSCSSRRPSRKRVSSWFSTMKILSGLAALGRGAVSAADGSEGSGSVLMASPQISREAG